jgi:hypothetical protein
MGCFRSPQVDCDTDPLLRDPRSGKYRRTRLFVFRLGYSPTVREDVAVKRRE